MVGLDAGELFHQLRCLLRHQKYWYRRISQLRAVLLRFLYNLFFSAVVVFWSSSVNFTPEDGMAGTPAPASSSFLRSIAKAGRDRVFTVSRSRKGCESRERSNYGSRDLRALWWRVPTKPKEPMEVYHNHFRVTGVSAFSFAFARMYIQAKSRKP